MQRACCAGTTTATGSAAEKCFLRLCLTPRQPVTFARGVTNPRGDGEIFPYLVILFGEIPHSRRGPNSPSPRFKFSFLNPTESRKESPFLSARWAWCEVSRWPPRALKKPGVCSNYSHKGTLVMEMPLGWIKRSAVRRRWRQIYHLSDRG